MLPIFFALITYLGWGIGDIFGTMASRKIGGYNSAFYVSAIGFILSSFYAPFVLSDLAKFTPDILFLTIILAFVIPVALVSFYEGLRVGNAAVVGTIASSYSAVAVLLSVILLGERVSFYQGLFIAIIFLGIVLSGLDFKKLGARNFLFDKGIPYAILAMLLWGIFFAFIKIPISKVGWFWPGYISVFTFPLILLFMKFKKVKLEKLNKKTLIVLFLSALLINIGGFSYNIAVSMSSVVLIAPIASSAVTLFVILAFFIFKDKITRQQIAGIITTLVGIVLLSVFSI